MSKMQNCRFLRELSPIFFEVLKETLTINKKLTEL